MGLRPVARWHADANPAKRHICLSIVSVVYSSHSALKAQAGFRSIDRMGARSQSIKMSFSLSEFALYICWQRYRALTVIASVDIPTETLRTVLQPLLCFRILKRCSLRSWDPGFCKCLMNDVCPFAVIPGKSW